jgi:hypothetical protein
LEDIARIADNVIRDNQGCPKKRKETLCNQARQLFDIDLQLMPFGMKRQKLSNTSFNPKSKSISWTVEFNFNESEIFFQTHRNQSSSTLKELIDSILDVDAENKNRRLSLLRYCNQIDYFIYLKLEGQPAHFVQYVLCDSSMTLGDAMRHNTIIEYPTFTVCTYPML